MRRAALLFSMTAATLMILVGTAAAQTNESLGVNPAGGTGGSGGVGGSTASTGADISIGTVMFMTLVVMGVAALIVARRKAEHLQG
jgi:hypothetical protein